MFKTFSKLFLTSVVLANICFSSNAQATYKYDSLSNKLYTIFNSIRNTQNFEERDSLSKIAESIFDTILPQEQSFKYSFDTLDNLITCLYSDDNKIRIINWNIPLPDASYKYNGYIQYYDSKEQLFTSTKLKDNRPNIENPASSTLKPDNWYGALYYEIIPTRINRKEIVYVLLGWEGYTLNANRKIIDVVSFKNGKPSFGKDFFEMPTGKHKRIIFTYNFRAKMKLRWDKQFGMIIFDNLEKIPTLPTSFEGNMAPSMLFDGLIFDDNVWKYKHDIDIKPAAKNRKNKTKTYPY